ncbi:MAG TPA: sugar ABC transporter ATP-binding protein [Nonomuraea sp.]|nr:sugar ABC transporter ATP-binding protein [Nonomuraea sp.]
MKATEHAAARAAGDDPAPLLSVRGAVKHYGLVQALRGADLTVGRGEVHGLLGANGAGKSTLVKILAGLTRPDEGSFTLDGAPFRPGNIREAAAAGVRLAHQELAIVPALTVRQNLHLGRYLHPELTGAKERELAYAALFEEWGLDISLDAVMRELSPAHQATVALAKTLVGDGRLLILDEPTASLGPKEVSGLFAIIRRRVEAGAGVIFVSHRLGEVSRLCDAITVLRNGQRVHDGRMEGVDEHALADLIAHDAGGDRRRAARTTTTRAARAAKHASSGGPLLSVDGLRLQSRVHDVSFEVNPGEIVGIAGLVGSGRTEVLETLVGLRRIVSGEIRLGGRPHQPRDPAGALRQGVVLVPEERLAQAIFTQRDIVFNFSSSRFRTLGGGPGGMLSRRSRYRESARRLAESLRLKARSLNDSIMSLSGGNQQKVVLGRATVDGLRLLLLDEPTRGVDVGARHDFQQMVRGLADQGVGVVYVSSELAELEYCDRIVVMVEGRATVQFDNDDRFDEDELTRLCFLRADAAAAEQA